MYKNMAKSGKKMGRPRRLLPVKKLTLSIPEGVWEKWKIQAIKEKTTMSQLAVRLLTDHLKKRRS